MISTSFHCERCGKEKRVARSEGEAPVPAAVRFRWLLAHDVQSAGAMIANSSWIPMIPILELWYGISSLSTERHRRQVTLAA